jgi:hypothetical protein
MKKKITGTNKHTAPISRTDRAKRAAGGKAATWLSSCGLGFNW